MEGTKQKRTKRRDAEAGAQAVGREAIGDRSTLNSQLSTPPAQIVFYPFPGKIYTRREIAEIFSQLGPLDPLVVALRLICQVRFESAARDAAAPRLTEREAGHAGGRIEEITSFRDEILGYLNAEEPLGRQH